jgi:hypothetical protein
MSNIGLCSLTTMVEHHSLHTGEDQELFPPQDAFELEVIPAPAFCIHIGRVA